MAANCEKAALRSDAAALDGDRAAGDPANSPRVQAQAKAAAKSGRQHAREYREDAAALRAGRMPGEDW
ncbi:hypothetical protein AB0M68_03720 [Streptomyces sp. NPDC051453]|uniref:hypothetical protein n=1 Tax=Streptomyces sp. NPDC051453 TaxID=3154941 RepID=UPI0034458DDC